MAQITQELEDALWTDAHRIAWVGASNPAAVASTLARRTQEVIHVIGTRPACQHPALRAIAGHLAFLYGYGLGPDSEYLDLVESNARRLGLDVRL
jgi:hypothetical protein